MDMELKCMMQAIRLKYPNALIIIGGDFNRKEQWMRVLSRNLNLPLCQNDGQKLVTHCSARSSASNNQLDYILTNLPWH